MVFQQIVCVMTPEVESPFSNAEHDGVELHNDM